MTFLCPLCGAPGIARLGDGLVEAGRRAEGGAFRVLSFQVSPELAVAPQHRALRVWLLGRQRDVPVAQDAPSGPPAQPGA